MRRITLLLLTLALTNLGTAAEWKTLFDGKTLEGWQPTSEANWRVEDNAIVVDSGKRGFLIHEDTYQNYELTVEFKAAKGANSGIFLNTKRGKMKLTEDCYELNIAPPNNPFPTGSLVARAKVEGAGETDTWRRFDVRVKDGRVTVKLDGKQILDYRGKKPASGKLLGLQLNQGRVAFRNIRVRKLPWYKAVAPDVRRLGFFGLQSGLPTLAASSEIVDVRPAHSDHAAHGFDTGENVRRQSE